MQGSKRGANLNVQKYEQKQNYQISTRRVLSEAKSTSSLLPSYSCSFADLKTKFKKNSKKKF